MTVSYADFQRMQSDKRQATAYRDREQETMARVAGVQMKELMNKPDWKLYLDHVNAELEPAQRTLKSLEHQVLQKEDASVRKQYDYTHGLVDGLTRALNCGKTVVCRAEQSTEDTNVRRDQETS